MLSRANVVIVGATINECGHVIHTVNLGSVQVLVRIFRWKHNRFDIKINIDDNWWGLPNMRINTIGADLDIEDVINYILGPDSNALPRIKWRLNNYWSRQ